MREYRSIPSRDPGKMCSGHTARYAVGLTEPCEMSRMRARLIPEQSGAKNIRWRIVTASHALQRVYAIHTIRPCMARTTRAGIGGCLGPAAAPAGPGEAPAVGMAEVGLGSPGAAGRVEPAAAVGSAGSIESSRRAICVVLTAPGLPV